jgi:hypothetical protein
MRFQISSLEQFTPDYIASLPAERVCVLFEEMRQDLIETEALLCNAHSNCSFPEVQIKHKPPEDCR